MKVVHRFTANWRRLHVRVRVVHCSREEVSKLLHSFVLKTFDDYGEQDVTWKIVSYAQLKARQNQRFQSQILTVPRIDGMILLDRSDKRKWGQIDLK